ncbi:MAG: YaaL family protein [Tumebacillaceae bacterium]
MEEDVQKGLISRLTEWLRGRPSTQEEPTELDKLRTELEAAREEWAIAQRHIDYVSEPELIDHAIYYLEAAERKYGYLLREAKRRYADGELEPVEPLLQASE